MGPRVTGASGAEAASQEPQESVPGARQTGACAGRADGGGGAPGCALASPRGFRTGWRETVGSEGFAACPRVRVRNPEDKAVCRGCRSRRPVAGWGVCTLPLWDGGAARTRHLGSLYSTGTLLLLGGKGFFGLFCSLSVQCLVHSRCIIKSLLNERMTPTTGL